MAQGASKIWLDHGALQYVESVLDDADPMPGCGISFDKLAAAKKTETVIFAFVVYKSRAQRDKINKKVMADPRMQKMMEAMNPKKPIFDMARFSFGGFEALVDA
jgi:uncharacterized protein YbaA (DUF1428 family)